MLAMSEMEKFIDPGALAYYRLFVLNSNESRSSVCMDCKPIEG